MVGQIRYARDCEIWRAAGRKGKHRFTAVELVGDRLIATDDRMLASVPVKVEGDPPSAFWLDPEVLKAARKATRVNQDAVVSFDDSGAGPPGGVRYPFTNDHSKIPPVGVAMQDRGLRVKIGLDPKRLLELAKAIGADNGVYLRVSETGPILVHKVDKDSKLCNGEEDAFGLLFPVTPHP
jgi:hypothetical protein